MSEKTNIAALDYLNSYDPAVGEAMTAELKRQRRNLELIASRRNVHIQVASASNAATTIRSLPCVPLKACGEHIVFRRLGIGRYKGEPGGRSGGRCHTSLSAEKCITRLPMSGSSSRKGSASPRYFLYYFIFFRLIFFTNFIIVHN